MQRVFHWPVLAIFLLFVLAGCGGGSGGSAPPGGAGTSADGLGSVSANDATSSTPTTEAPKIEGVDLVSSTRVDRTRFDYTYAMRIREPLRNYESAAFKVSINAPGSSMIDGDVNVGPIQSGRIIIPKDTFTIRHDRSIPFQKDKLAYAFSGAISNLSLPTSSIRFGGVEFLELAGAPGHEGPTPIRTEAPLPGNTYKVRAIVHGNVATVKCAFIDAIGTVIKSETMTKTWSDFDWFFLDAKTPATAFKLQIMISGVNGETRSWVSNLYSPNDARIILISKQDVFNYGDKMILNITVVAGTKAFNRTLMLALPDGFTSDSGPWSLNLKPGEGKGITATISTPTDQVLNRRFNIVARAQSANPNEQDLITSLNAMAR